MGDSNLYLVVNVPSAAVQPTKDLKAMVCGLTRDLGGRVSAEYGMGTVKRDVIGYSRPAEALATMRAIKAVLDPYDILNSGKEFFMTSLRTRIAEAALPDQVGLRRLFLAIPAAMVVEITCASGSDFVRIDMEHGPISAETGKIWSVRRRFTGWRRLQRGDAGGIETCAINSRTSHDSRTSNHSSGDCGGTAFERCGVHRDHLR